MRWLHSAGQPNAAETHTASTSSSTCPRCPSLPFRKSNWRQSHKRFLALGPTVEAWLLELISTRRVAAPALSSSAKAEDLCYRWTPRHREKSSYLPSAGGGNTPSGPSSRFRSCSRLTWWGIAVDGAETRGSEPPPGRYVLAVRWARLCSRGQCLFSEREVCYHLKAIGFKHNSRASVNEVIGNLMLIEYCRVESQSRAENNWWNAVVKGHILHHIKWHVWP